MQALNQSSPCIATASQTADKHNLTDSTTYFKWITKFIAVYFVSNHFLCAFFFFRPTLWTPICSENYFDSFRLRQILNDFIMKYQLLICLIVISSVTLPSKATIAPPDKNKKSKPAKELKVNKGPVEKNVFDRYLVQDEPASESIIKHSGTYYKNTSARLFDGPTLGFVTPVNLPFFTQLFDFFLLVFFLKNLFITT